MKKILRFGGGESNDEKGSNNVSGGLGQCKGCFFEEIRNRGTPECKRKKFFLGESEIEVPCL